LRHAQVHSPGYRPLGAILALALLLGGCAELQKHPEAAAVPPPPEPVACVNPAQIPAEPPMVGQKFNGDAKHDLQVLAPNAKALRDWGEKLRLLLEACEPPPPVAAAAKP
jgi:hypothetical protein